MKISNEAKVGILAITAIVVLVLGFNFLKGRSLFKKQTTLYAIFNNLGTLDKSNQVKINGLPVGNVVDYQPIDKEVNGVIVEIRLTRDINIPKNSFAFIDGAPLQASYITVSKGNSNIYLQSGDTISTDPSSRGIMEDIKTQVKPTITKVNETLDSLKMMIGSVNEVFDENTNRNLKTMIAHLTISSAHLQTLLNAQTGALAQTLNNMNAVTGNLARNNDAITHSIRNVEVTTTKLANARIQETVSELEGTVAELKSAAQGLKTSIEKINSPNGTLGALVNDRKLYDQLNRAALGLEILLDDVRVHPKRYVNISVFGNKGKSAPLTSPAIKDSVPRR